MNYRLPNLTWLRTFEAAGRLLNFTAAGKELGLTQTAVSLHIKSLEAALGDELFNRQPRHLKLTEMGQAYMTSVRKSLNDINMSTNSLFGPEQKRTVTIKAPIATVTLWLVHLLPGFLEAHPSINIRLVSSIWFESNENKNADINIRLGYGDWPDMHIEKISDETIVPICPTAAKNSYQQPEDFLNANLIHILGYEDHWGRYFLANGIDKNKINARYLVDTTIAAYELVAAGGGCAAILARFANRAVQAGNPITIAGEPMRFPQAHYLTEPMIPAAPRQEVEMVKSWLRERFKEP